MDWNVPYRNVPFTMDWNVRAYNALYLVFSRIEGLGLGISILAWISVLFAAVAMGILLRKFSMRKVWIPSLIVGLASGLAHILDYIVTLRISANLTDESNPIWRIVIDNLGVNIAKAYGLTGKILLSVLSFELFAYYLIQRERLFPKQAGNFFDFWKKFGSSNSTKKIVRWSNLVNFFSFSFALLGPFFFYAAFLNSIVSEAHYYHVPSLPIMLFLYLVALCFAYLATTYQAFQSTINTPI